MIDRLTELPRVIIHSLHLRTVAFAAGALIFEAVCTTPVIAQEPINANPVVASLRVEDWQKGALRLGLSALLTGAFALRLGSTLRQNEGSSKWQKRWNNTGLIAQGAGTALVDVIMLTFPL